MCGGGGGGWLIKMTFKLVHATVAAVQLTVKLTFSAPSVTCSFNTHCEKTVKKYLVTKNPNMAVPSTPPISNTVDK